MTKTSSLNCKPAVAMLFLSILLVHLPSAKAASSVTLEALISEMTSMQSMAEFPSPSYTCKQFSSYDRASKSPDKDWFANGDAGQFIRVENGPKGKEYVMMDAQGPGAIVRIWSANPAGNIRIYIDGNKEPEIVAPMDQLLGGKFPGLPKPIAGEYSKGWNLYFPIPYARHCKVTSDKGGFYYHVNYRTYEPGMEVQPFKGSHISELRTVINRLAENLSKAASLAPSGVPSEFDLEIPPGEKVVNKFEGPAAIVHSIVSITRGRSDAALRGVILRAQFDGEQCVEVPLGDFFGSAPGINPFESLPLGMSKQGTMYSQWVMPFRESAVIELWNTTSETVRLEGKMVVAAYKWTDRSMHFHAGWRTQSDVPTRPMIDWNYLTASGKGVFAGASFAIDNPVKHWWGEGDEKIYVDGENFPSHFGTGTEDYYGYAWCWPGLFTHAYHAQPLCDGPGNYGRTSVNRFHIIDRIPFNKSFKFDMELWHWNANTKVNMAITAYWYGIPGAKSDFEPVTPKLAVVRPLEPYVVQRVPGAIEGETMKILAVKGTAAPQDWADLSGEQHLWWHQGFKPGDTLTLGFDVAEQGRYKMVGRFLSAKDYGIHQLSINGKPAGEPIDFYKPDVTPTPERDLGEFDLKKGENKIEVKAIGANPSAVKSYMFGLDYLKLQKLP